MDMTFRFTTDTASIAVFDVQALQHRLDDRADWWSLPSEELLELNRGNLVIVGLGVDGTYSCHVHDGPLQGHSNAVSARVRCISDRLFVGPGENIVGGGLTPALEFGGAFVQVGPGNYLVQIQLNGPDEVEVAINSVEGSGDNSFTEPLFVEW